MKRLVAFRRNINGSVGNINVDEIAKTFIQDNFIPVRPMVNRLLDTYDIDNVEPDGFNYAHDELEEELAWQGIKIGEYTEAIQNEIDTGNIPAEAADHIDEICSKIRQYETDYLHAVVNRWAEILDRRVTML